MHLILKKEPTPATPMGSPFISLLTPDAAVLILGDCVLNGLDAAAVSRHPYAPCPLNNGANPELPVLTSDSAARSNQRPTAIMAMKKPGINLASNSLLPVLVSGE